MVVWGGWDGLRSFGDGGRYTAGPPADDDGDGLSECAGDCVETDDAADTMATDPYAPSPGRAFYYLIRAENDCPSGQGALGARSDGTPVPGRDCP